MPNMLLNTSLHKSFGLLVHMVFFVLNECTAGWCAAPPTGEGWCHVIKGFSLQSFIAALLWVLSFKTNPFWIFVCVPTFPGYKAPLHYTSTGLQRRGFPPGVSGSVLLPSDPVQNQPHFHLRFSGHQTQLAECSESCCDRMAYSMLTGCLWQQQRNQWWELYSQWQQGTSLLNVCSVSRVQQQNKCPLL